MSSDGEMQVAVVVEDDLFLRELICELLQVAGFRTFGCKDGFEGLQAAHDLRPSVLTLDLHMPGMDGEEVLSKLDSDETTATLPVVVVSAYTSDRRVRSWRQVKAVIQKPFDVEDLLQKVLMAANGN